MSWQQMAGVLLAYVVINVVVVLVVFPHGWLSALQAPSGGLVDATLCANLILLVLVGGVLRWMGLRGRDSGFDRAQWPSALIALILIWFLLNAIQASLAFLAHVSITPNPLLETGRLGYLVGPLLAQLLGNALFEEMFFRGVLLRQCAARLLSGGHPFFRSLVLAVMISQTAFALAHVPLRLHDGVTGWPLVMELAALFVLGSLLAIAYIATRNLALVVVVHALSNAPTYLVAERVDFESSGAIVVAGCVLLTIIAIIHASIARNRLREAGP